MQTQGAGNRDYEEGDTPKADGINYLRDVNAAAKDLINLLRSTVEAMERLLRSRDPDSMYDARASEPKKELEELDLRKNDHRDISIAETGDIHRTEYAEEGSENVRRDISETASAFLTAIRFFVDYIENRMNVSPMQQQEQEREIRHALRSSAQTEMDIRSLNAALSAQRTEHKKVIDKLNERLETCRKMMDEKTTEVRNEINRIVNESEFKMVQIYKKSVVKQNSMHSEIRILECRLNDQRKSNIAAENELRGKRCQVEAELINFLAKYDSEIGGRHVEMENLANEFELLDTERKSLENDVMVDLRKIHDDLQREKAEALLKLLNERVENFVRNRAARVIQKAWRAYWERHCAKKKKKSRRK